jgi:ParB family chromosome partitioning protein
VTTPINKINVINRTRKEKSLQTNLDGLAASISKIGLINPITITQPNSKGKHTLLCGERRLEAAKLLKWKKIPAIEIQVEDEHTHLLLELEENLQREEFTWQEIVSLKGRLFYSMLEQNQHLTQEQFSKDVLYQSTGLTSQELQLYDASGDDPTVLFIESMAKALEFVKQKRLTELMKEQQDRAIEQMEAGEELEEQTPVSTVEVESDTKEESQRIPVYKPVLMSSAEELLDSFTDHSIDGMVTDPPFGIDIQSVKGRDDGAQVYEHGDSAAEYHQLIYDIFAKLKRVLKPGANCYMFFSMVHHRKLLDMLEALEYTFWPHPLIWVKSINSALLQPGSCQAPDLYPAMSYHPILFFRAPGKARTLRKMGQPNVFFCPGVPPSAKTHPLEIPGPVYSELQLRSFHPGDTVVDPFCGSGNSLRAGMNQGFKMYGSELVEQYRVAAEDKIQQQMKVYKDIVKGG